MQDSAEKSFSIPGKGIKVFTIKLSSVFVMLSDFFPLLFAVCTTTAESCKFGILQTKYVQMIYLLTLLEFI